jgi:hypothetical protein
MATKKQRRTDEVKHKKTKKTRRIALLSVIIVVSVVFLALFFITLFDYIYPPASGKHSAAKKREKKEVALFFSDATERFLVPEKRLIPMETEPELQAAEIVKALLEGSKTGLVNTFPEKCGLHDVRIEGGDTALVNFKENMVTAHPGGSAAEMATIYSLTNTLATNMVMIKKVRVLIGGKERESIKGHISTKNPFTLNKELIAPPAPPKEG